MEPPDQIGDQSGPNSSADHTVKFLPKLTRKNTLTVFRLATGLKLWRINIVKQAMWAKQYKLPPNSRFSFNPDRGQTLVHVHGDNLKERGKNMEQKQCSSTAQRTTPNSQHSQLIQMNSASDGSQIKLMTKLNPHSAFQQKWEMILKEQWKTKVSGGKEIGVADLKYKGRNISNQVLKQSPDEQYKFQLHQKGSRAFKIYRGLRILLYQANAAYILQLALIVNDGAPNMNLEFLFNLLCFIFSCCGVMCTISIEMTAPTLNVLLSSVFSGAKKTQDSGEGKRMDWSGKWWQNPIVILVGLSISGCSILLQIAFLGVDVYKLVSGKDFSLMGSAFQLESPYSLIFAGLGLLVNAGRNVANNLVMVVHFNAFLATMTAYITGLEDFLHKLSHASASPSAADKFNPTEAMRQYKQIILFGHLTERFTCAVFVPGTVVLSVLILTFLSCITFVVPTDMPLPIFCIFPVCLVVMVVGLTTTFGQLARIPKLRTEIHKKMKWLLYHCNRRRVGEIVINAKGNERELELIKKTAFRAGFFGFLDMLVNHKVVENTMSLILIVKDMY